MNEFVEANRANYLEYEAGVKSIRGLNILPYHDNEATNYQYLVMLLEEEVAGIKRDTLIDVLHRENIMARRYFYPGCHRMEPYRSQQPDAGLLLPETEKLARQTIVLPTGTEINSEIVQEIVDILRCAIEHSAQLPAHMVD